MSKSLTENLSKLKPHQGSVAVVLVWPCSLCDLFVEPFWSAEDRPSAESPTIPHSESNMGVSLDSAYKGLQTSASYWDLVIGLHLMTDLERVLVDKKYHPCIWSQNWEVEVAPSSSSGVFCGATIPDALCGVFSYVVCPLDILITTVRAANSCCCSVGQGLISNCKIKVSLRNFICSTYSKCSLHGWLRHFLSS